MAYFLILKMEATPYPFCSIQRYNPEDLLSSNLKEIEDYSLPGCDIV
jgi:hypothetical protein